MKDLLEQGQKVMFDYSGKKRFGVIMGLLKIFTEHLYMVKLDKKIKDYPYECVGVFGNGITKLEDDPVELESYEVETRRGGCIS